MPQSTNIHATGVVIAGIGMILRGPSGAGKSLLALELLQAADTAGIPAALIADDRLDLSVEGGQIIAHAPSQIGGLIELRGRGIVSRPFEPSAPITLVIDLVEELTRLVEEDALETHILGIRLARCPVPHRGVIDAGHQRLLIDEALRAVKKTA